MNQVNFIGLLLILELILFIVIGITNAFYISRVVESITEKYWLQSFGVLLIICSYFIICSFSLYTTYSLISHDPNTPSPFTLLLYPASIFDAVLYWSSAIGIGIAIICLIIINISAIKHKNR